MSLVDQIRVSIVLGSLVIDEYFRLLRHKPEQIRQNRDGLPSFGKTTFVGSASSVISETDDVLWDSFFFTLKP